MSINKHYMFGYGSLICPMSREWTGKSGESIPVRVQGVERLWNFRDVECKYTAVGIREADTTCNGVLVSVPESDLQKFDEREGGYVRKKIAPKDVSVLAYSSLPGGDIWVYIPDSHEEATEDFPLSQTYIDLILNGCLDFGEDFTREFIRTTALWSKHWVNDRAAPLRVREYLKIENYGKIDQILNEEIHMKFS